MPRRRKARESALQLLYQWEGERSDPVALLPSFWEGRKADAATRRFAEELFTGAVAALDEIDPLIEKHSEHWRAAVVMDEALEIAKRFSSADSVEFINGILDAIHKTLTTGAKAG
jgi:N utilization substance protein B